MYSTPWALLAIPFVVLGSFHAAPNLNLADGFLVVIATIAGCVVAHFHREAGDAIVLGSLPAWVLSAAEKRLRAVPIYESLEP
jgi:hypothetical protein